MIEEKIVLNSQKKKKREELISLGIEGTTKLSDIAFSWNCTPEFILEQLYFIQKSHDYALLIDGDDYFRFFGRLTKPVKANKKAVNIV